MLMLRILVIVVRWLVRHNDDGLDGSLTIAHGEVRVRNLIATGLSALSPPLVLDLLLAVVVEAVEAEDDAAAAADRANDDRQLGTASAS